MPTARIGWERVRGTKTWKVTSWEGGKRTRVFFPSHAKAEAELIRLRDLQKQAGSEWSRLPDVDREAVAALWARAKRDGVDLQKLFDERQTTPTTVTIDLGPAIEELVAAKTKANCRPAYVTNLGMCLRAFARGREKKPLALVDHVQVEDWLRLKGGTPHTRAMWRSRLSTLLSWAVRRGYLERNPADRVESVRIEHRPPRILSVAECRKLLNLTRTHCPRLLPWVVLGLFAGLRPGELDLLPWSAVQLDSATVTVDAAASKVRRRRIVPLEKVAIEWLKLCSEASKTMPLPYTTRRRDTRQLCKQMEWASWPSDVLRHSCASYWLATHQDAGKVALWLGNSAGILMRHYRELVPVSAAKKWLRLRPTA